MLKGGSPAFSEKLPELAACSPDDALDGIFRALGTDIKATRAADGASAIALVLDKHLLRLAERQSRIYPLSILPVLDFIMRKKEEVDLVRLIVRSKSAGIPDNKIREMILT
jgi:vacuolar-type H+-ATPase subunit C/Vma6